MTTNVGPTLLRCALGAVFIAYGLPRLLPGGEGGLAATAELIESVALMPGPAIAVGLAVVEVVGGFMLVLGALTSWAALGLIAAAAAWARLLHLSDSLAPLWPLDALAGHGLGFYVVVIAGLLCLAFTGPGACSVDAWRARSAEVEAAGRERLRRAV